MRSAAATLSKTVTLSWLTGPIFDKELRISSRRKRNYVLRSAYLAILLLALVLIWVEMVGSRNANITYQASRLYRAGLAIISTIVVIQFFAAQIFSVIMLSNSISDEIYHKTLGVLMTTPINSLQIVTGKFLSKLLQIFLMMGLTLPILGIVRVFGGVPWDFLLASFCLTLTSVLFAGILSLTISIHSKHAYVVIIVTLLLLLLLFVLLPLFGAWILYEGFGLRENKIVTSICLANPWLTICLELVKLNEPGVGIPAFFGWGWNCLGTLAVSAGLFIRAVCVVRKKALLQACGQLSESKKRSRNPETNAGAAKIRHIQGPPLLWKEIRQPMFNIGPVKKTLLFLFVAGCLIFSYFIFESEGGLDEEYFHFLYSFIFVIIGVFFTTVFSATTITSERSSRNWPMLLGTLISDSQIIIAKTMGVLRRSAPIWLLLIGHIMFFSFIVRYIHPVAFFQILLIIIPIILFVSASGIMFSTLLKNTTSAVVMNLIFVVVVWAVIPFLAAILSIPSGSGDLVELVVALNPFYHLGMVLEQTAGSHNAHDSLSELQYYWIIDGEAGFFVTTLWLFVIGLGYLFVSWLMWILTKNILRTKVFR